MSWQTFILQMTHALAWPVVVLLLVGRVFTKPIADALGRLTELSGLGFKAKLAAKVRKLRTDATGSAPVQHIPSVTPDSTATVLSTMLALAPTAPRAAAETAYEVLVARLRSLLASRITVVNATISPYAMTLMLMNLGVLKDVVPPGAKPLPEVVADAQGIIGRVIDGASIGRDDAATYVSTIVDILDRIKLGLS